MGSYEHRFALTFGDRAQAALLARWLRTAVPLIRVCPDGGDWPAERSLLNVTPATAHVTAFRTGRKGCEIVVNDLSGRPGKVSCNRRSARLVPYGVATIRVK
jgi:hypothetical protein